MPSVFCFVPTFGQQLTTTTFLTTHALQQALNFKGVGGGISALSYPDIAELRNIAMTIWYDTLRETHLLFIDADMGFDPQIVLDMLLFDQPIVGALCPKRVLPVQWAGAGDGRETTEVRAGFMKVAGVGMAVTLIRRDAIKIMLEKMPHLSDTRLHMHSAKDIIEGAGTKRIIRAFDKIDDPENGPLSEDLSFCRRWRECGGEIWANMMYRISHVGPYPYGADISYMEWAKQREESEALKAAE